MRAFITAASGLIFFALASAPVAHAQNDAGCGLGSMIIQENTKLMQLFAATTNTATFTNFFGITSGTSNCRAQGLVMREKAAQYFAEVNRESLLTELSRGTGEKLSTLAALFGCDSTSQTEFVDLMQNSYEKILPEATTTASELVRNIHRELKSDAALAQSCRQI